MSGRLRNSRVTRAFTMIEAMVSVVILGVMLVVALQVVGASTANQFRTAQRATASYLAQGLLNDIVQLSYQDPGANPVFGLEAGESPTSKVNYDDVDDFNSWAETLPQDRNGTPMSELPGWSRSVVVQWANPAAPTQTSLTETGLKRITVTVSYNGNIMASRTGLKGKYP